MSIWSILFSYKGRISPTTYRRAVAMRNLVFYISFAVAFFSIESRSFIAAVPFALLLLPLFYVGYPIRVKRWHDRDKSGWWVLIALIPIFGWCWTIVECSFLKGTEGSNRFGPDPLLNDLNPDLIKYVTVSTGTADNPWLATAHLVGSTGNREPRIIYGGEDESEARRQAVLFSERFQCEIIQ